MIDVSSLRATSFAFKLITPSKVQQAHSNNLKNRRIILSRYQKVGNPQDFSQIPLSARDSFNVNGQKPRSESHDRKTHRPTTRESCESPSIISLRFNPPSSAKRSTVMSRTHSQPFIRPPILLSRSQSTIGTPMMTMRTHTQVTTRKESEISVLPEKKETEVFEEKNVKTTLGHLDELPLQKSIVIKTSKAVMSEGNEKNEKNIAFSLLKDMKSVTSFVAIAKFLKKKAQRTVAKKNGKKEQKDEKTIAPTSPQVRVVQLINPEIVEENNNMVCNYANPIAAMFEDIPSEEFYKQLSGDVFTPKRLLEYIENSDLWDPLGEMIDIHTDQKLEYQATYTKFKKNRHFNLEDYGLLEWRSQAKDGTVRKIYHRQSLKVFALRSINLEKFNNDPTDVKNDLRICSLLIKHPHKAILRFISSKLAIVSDSSPRTKRSGSVDMLMDLKASLNMNVEVVGELGVVNLKELNKMRKKQGIKWTEDELIILLKELVSALAHCESLGIAHRNIKPSNIFFGEDKVTTKLTDFKLGLLTTSRQKRIETNVVGTPRYMSYELKRVYNNLKAKKIAASMIKYDPFLSDVSSLALVILELTMLSLSPEKAMIKLEVESAVIILKEIKEIYPNLSKTLQRMLSHEPNMRPRFNELEAALTLPNEAHRREVYDIRYNLVTHLDETRREDVISADDYMEMTKAYVRIVMSERQNKRAVNQKENPAWKRDKTMKKKEGAVNGVQDKGIGSQSYRASVLKMLNRSFEEYRNKGQYKKAISALTMMGDVLFQIYHTDEKEGFVYVISNLARMNQLLNLCRESVEFYVQAYNISKKCYGETSLPSAILLNNIASLYYSTGETQRVKEVYQRALKIKETLGLTEQISYAIGLQNMANTNQITGDIKAAVNDYHEALRIYTTFFDDVIKETGELYLAISVLHYAVRGDKESGEQYILHALDIYREAPVEIRDGLLGTAYYRLGLFKYCFKEFEAASDAYEKAIKFLEIAIVKQVGLLDAVKDSQRTLRNEAGFVVEMKKSKLL